MAEQSSQSYDHRSDSSVESFRSTPLDVSVERIRAELCHSNLHNITIHAARSSGYGAHASSSPCMAYCGDTVVDCGVSFGSVTGVLSCLLAVLGAKGTEMIIQAKLSCNL